MVPIEGISRLSPLPLIPKQQAKWYDPVPVPASILEEDEIQDIYLKRLESAEHQDFSGSGRKSFKSIRHDQHRSPLPPLRSFPLMRNPLIYP